MPSLENRQTRVRHDSIDQLATPSNDLTQRRPRTRGRRRLLVVGTLLFVAGGIVGITSRWWWPHLSAPLALGAGVTAVDDHDHDHDDDHAHESDQGHDHDHEDEPAAGTAADAAHGHEHDEATLELTPQGRKNIGLTLTTVELKDFARTVSMPATVGERAGQTELSVSAPMTGIVTKIHPMRGEAVRPGEPLFELRLTHEDLVEKQSSLLRSLEELDVVKREVSRLEDVTASGAVAGKRLLEREYEQQKIEANIRAEKQALLLHGLTDQQVEQIVETRQLLKSLTIVAPPPAEHVDTDEHVEYLQVSEIFVKMGEHVATGTQLAAVTDHCELLIEGRAFEQDAKALNRAANEHAEITALISTQGAETDEVAGLRILYVENRVQRDSRALKFYVGLPNELVRNEESPGGNRFIGWRYRPGQRVELLVPIERWEKRIVLPIESVVQEGPEAYVYLDCQGHFDRKPVHVEYRDQRHAVIESDGLLFPGDKIVARGAYQIHLALKNRSSGTDPHAGHHH